VQQVYWPVGSRSLLRSLSSFSLVIRGQASDNHRLVTEFSRVRPSESVAHTPWVRRAKRQNARPQRRQVCASREPRAALQSSILIVKSCVSQGFSIIFTSSSIFRSDSVPVGCQLARFRLRPFPYLSDGSGSIRIRRPCSSLLFKRLNATATSETSVISTNPNPRQSPETRSVTPRALRTPPPRKNAPEDHPGAKSK
jgi:hypothetical protein